MLHMHKSNLTAYIDLWSSFQYACLLHNATSCETAVTLSFQLPFLVKEADTQHMLQVLISDRTFGTSDTKKILHYEHG
jgi:hypothetical protein